MSMSSFERQAWAFGLKAVGALCVAATVWLVFTWPWLLATKNASEHGHPKGSAAYNAAGWTAELLYLGGLAVLVAFGTMGAKSYRRHVWVKPGWRHAPTDPFGMQRWWDGSFWTERTQWDFEVARYHSQYFSHRGCTLRHRSRRAAALHKFSQRER
jgi:uncharacterized protein DUF2510